MRWQKKKILVPAEQCTTNCTKCEVTCHEHCPIKDDSQKMECLAMTDGHCNICPGRCHWSSHKVQPFVYSIKAKSKTLTTKELKAKYQTKEDMQLTSKKLIAILTVEIKTTRSNIIALAEQASKSIEKLDRIALKPSPLSTVDYIDQLIVSERDEGKPRWKERVEQLERVKWKAEYMHILKRALLLAQKSSDAAGSVQEKDPRNMTLLALSQGRTTIILWLN